MAPSDRVGAYWEWADAARRDERAHRLRAEQLAAAYATIVDRISVSAQAAIEICRDLTFDMNENWQWSFLRDGPIEDAALIWGDAFTDTWNTLAVDSRLKVK